MTELITVYDSVTPADIPTGAKGIAGYVDGAYGPANANGWTEAAWARFSASFRIGIAVSASTDAGHFLDVETGNATPGQVAGWVEMRIRAGLKAPGVYCSADNEAAIAAARAAGAVLWIASWTGTPPETMATDQVGTQYADPDHSSGGHWDLSVFDPDYFSEDLGPADIPVMPTLHVGASGDVVAYLEELLASHGFSPADSLQADGEWDGRFGKGVLAAVMAFQKANTLSPDGIVGPLTWTALAEHP